ncbi:MAG: hypothetical protein A2516_10065 [Alphaproteobacteria bacterium RIFOXYD12_FULL_60_8]|nr:MAG: hypothetical protein A2516_10065 [Alphaproteobacteria bacterium RIFOXYD12_FULL_60_8]
MKSIAFLAVLLALTLGVSPVPALAQEKGVAPPAKAATITGPASVRDGDSLFVLGREVRLSGVDAPEWDQKCAGPDGKPWLAGQEAAAWLRSRLDGQTVSCVTETMDRYHRAISTCFLGGENVNETLVREGWAVAYTRYSIRYVPAEDAAKAEGRGIWRGRCDPPEAWRRSGK